MDETSKLLLFKIPGLKLPDLNLTVHKIVEYERGEEEGATAHNVSQVEGREKVVLFVPSGFNEAHVDLVYRCWIEENGWESWKVVGLQISAGTWANKKRKGSMLHGLIMTRYESGFPEGPQHYSNFVRYESF